MERICDTDVNNYEKPNSTIQPMKINDSNDNPSALKRSTLTTHIESLVEMVETVETKPNMAAWLQVLLSHLINFNAFGYMLSFGVFQGYYTEVLGFEPSTVSWIGTIQLFLNFFVGVFSGRAMDVGYYPYTLTAGLALQLVSVFTTSVSTQYYQLLLSQGICYGIGNGLLFCPAVALVSTYFPSRHRALALSFVACGGATGGMVFPAIAQSLLPKLGFVWTLRVMGFVMLVIAIIVLPFSRTRIKPRTKSLWIDKTALKEPAFVLFCLGVFFGFWGLYFAFYYVRPFGRNILRISEKVSFDSILIINSFGIPGRIVPAILADRYFGSLDVMIPFIFFSGCLLFIWIGLNSSAGFFVWVAFYGFFAGGCQSLFQSASAKFSPDPSLRGVRIGMVCTLVSFACLSGPPIAGRLIENLDGKYLAAQLFGGSSTVLGGILLTRSFFLLQRP
jgi:MFS family permease